MSEIEILKGKTLTEITGKAGDDELIFTDSEGIKYRMWHDQNCCEGVYLESIADIIKEKAFSRIHKQIPVIDAWTNEQVTAFLYKLGVK